MYSYKSNNNLIFPTNYQLRSFYTLYTGGYTDVDEGYTSQSIKLPGLFYMNGNYHNEFYMNTNGCMYFTSPSSQFQNIPDQNYIINGNAGDLYLQPGRGLDDGSRSGVYYKETVHSMGGYSMEVAVNCGFYDQELTPASYLINLYRDTEYQYVVVMSKSNPTSEYASNPDRHAGPWSDPDTTQTNSTNSQVWRSDLNGYVWEYMGNGSLAYSVSAQKTCGSQGCGARVGKVCLLNSNSCTCAQYRYFYPRCSKIQQSLGICSGRAGAWVAATTVCSQKLF